MARWPAPKPEKRGGGGEKYAVITRYESRAFEPFKNLQLVHSRNSIRERALRRMAQKLREKEGVEGEVGEEEEEEEEEEEGWATVN